MTTNKEIAECLKAARAEISKQNLVIWFNERNIDYYFMDDIDMYIYYFENIPEEIE